MPAISPRENREYLDGLSDLLRRHVWHNFFTGTFDPEKAATTPKSPDRVLALTSRFFNSCVQKRKKNHKGMWWFAVVEGSNIMHYHVHALIGTWPRREGHNARRTDFSDIWGKWFKFYGRCTIGPVRDPEAVNRYLSKYLLKNGAEWFDLDMDAYEQFRTGTQEEIDYDT